MGTGSYLSLPEAPISFELKDLKSNEAAVNEDEEKGSTFLDIVEAAVNAREPLKSGGDLIHWSLFAQSFPTLILSNIGFILTGLIIDIVQHWDVFVKITELFIMMPVLLNLKGNLEMGLAARLSTSANKMEDESGSEMSLSDPMVLGNVLLVQFQALAAGLLVGLLSCVLGLVAHGQLNSPSEMLLIISCSSMTAFLSSALTSILLAMVIVKSRQAKINPDNISTPLANCLGDLSTMCVLALIARSLFALSSSLFSGVLLVISVLMVFIWGAMAHRIEATSQLLWEGWPPVISAIMISSLAGLAFERSVRYFEGLGLILTVVNGLCGNAASIYAARIATNLRLDRLEEGRERNRSAKRTLLFLCTPIQLLFLALLHITNLGHTSITVLYAAGHLLATNIHLLLILGWLAPNLVRQLWMRNLDPDTYTMPLLAAFSDLSGTIIFIATFSVLWLLGDRDANVGT